MQTKKDYSFGVVLFLKNKTVPQVLLVEQIGARGDVFWTIPKGHLEEGETPEEAARRELLEETGITEVVLYSQHRYDMHYEFLYQGIHIEKTVIFFLGVTTQEEVSRGSEGEIAQVMWCDVTDALSHVSHQAVRDIIVRAQVDVVPYLGDV